ncbi:UDP-N-acetylglucosamine transferase subunit ALG13 [Candida albicans P87]|nr:UDP-N-acetylglucosamine transferase subunit ALG13 [Candida albicans GC75]KGU14435.1 UDP-N-acetylglucosamine transferase subunit ALG13 [Candida albicans P87]KHC75512.1 UDP-N-acetylglucosamine transferase subunit ALG13 [Candida albicans P75016]
MFDWRRLKPLRPHQIFFFYTTIQNYSDNGYQYSYKSNQIKSNQIKLNQQQQTSRQLIRINNQLPPSVVLHNIIMKSILITTGATITFESLIQIIVSPQFLNNLIRLKINKLIIQYGHEIKNSINLSESFFNETINKYDLINLFNLEIEETPIGDDDDEGIRLFKNSDIEILAFSYSSNINKYIENVDLIISHAGTGSIIDCLHLNKPLIVIVNDKLMDNHQLEIAQQFTKLNYCIYYSIKELEQYVNNNDNNKDSRFWNQLNQLINGELQLNKLPQTDGSIIETIICEELEK